mmetsp:Transcript_58489/g.181650  ORF Transcript_58489/g.181650 Transcript_58489/m.181650 type:complete len:200 (+) Transcript_58489:294-893(+)
MQLLAQVEGVSTASPNDATTSPERSMATSSDSNAGTRPWGPSPAASCAQPAPLSTPCPGARAKRRKNSQASTDSSLAVASADPETADSVSSVPAALGAASATSATNQAMCSVTSALESAALVTKLAPALLMLLGGLPAGGTERRSACGTARAVAPPSARRSSAGGGCDETSRRSSSSPPRGASPGPRGARMGWSVRRSL